MGVVYKARHKSLNRLVALKIILSAGHPSAADLARFRAEAIDRLQHPNIVQIHEVGESGGRSLTPMDVGRLAPANFRKSVVSHTPHTQPIFAH